MDREDELQEIFKKYEEIKKKSRVRNNHTLKSYLISKSFNRLLKCPNELQRAFGLIGISEDFAKNNNNPIYCRQNDYYCCSEQQVRQSMTNFGKASVNLKKNLDPIIEVGTVINSEDFIEYINSWLKHPVCTNIIKMAFDKDPLNPRFNARKFFYNINVYDILFVFLIIIFFILIFAWRFILKKIHLKRNINLFN